MTPKPPPPPVPQLIAVWSPNALYMLAGKENLGQLTLQVGGNNPVPLNPGDEVAITNVPSDWKVVPSEPLWSWTGKGLTWNGTAPFSVSPAPQSTQPIYLTVTPSANAGSSFQVNVQLLKSDGTTLSTQCLIGFSMYTSQPTLAAYAKGSAFVLLSNPSAVSYPNTLDCALQALQEVSQGTQLTLSFYGWAQDQCVDLSGTVKSEALEIDGEFKDQPIPFTNNGNGTWTASLPDMAPQDKLDVTIKGLSLSATNLDLLEVRFVTGQGTTSAWFTAFGPYTLSMVLDTNNPDRSKYCVAVGDPSTFLVYFVDGTLINTKNEVQVPLVWLTLDARGQNVFVPVPARFSLNDPNPPPGQPSENLYNIGSNTLYWLDASNVPIVQCDIDVIYVTSSSVGPFSFCDMDLSEDDFSNWTNLGGSDFTNAILVNTSFNNARLDNCKMDGVTMNGTTTPYAGLTGASFVGASFIKAKLIGASDSQRMKMLQCDLSRCKFDGASFEHCSFYMSHLDSSTYLNATLSDVRMAEGSRMPGIDFTNVNFSGGMLEGDCSGMTLAQATLTNVDVSYSDFSNAKFSNITSSGISDGYQACILPTGWSLVNGQFVQD